MLYLCLIKKKKKIWQIFNSVSCLYKHLAKCSELKNKNIHAIYIHSTSHTHYSAPLSKPVTHFGVMTLRALLKAKQYIHNTMDCNTPPSPNPKNTHHLFFLLSLFPVSFFFFYLFSPFLYFLRLSFIYFSSSFSFSKTHRPSVPCLRLLVPRSRCWLPRSPPPPSR